MLTYPNIDPVAVRLGPIVIYWYGVMYLLGFLLAYGSCYLRRLTQTPPWTTDNLLDLFFYGAIGVIFGGTIGYFLFYEPYQILSDPLRILRFWEPGRSFHGGLLGVMIAVLFFCKRHHRRFWDVMDFAAPAVPLGLATGRLGNFINGELWGRVTDAPWGMVFPHVGSLPRHPSQLYEFFLEGLVLWIILEIYARKEHPKGCVSGLFLVGYGLFRYLIEFFREPDIQQSAFLGGWITMGQMLSIPMILIGLALMGYGYCHCTRVQKG